VATLFSSLEISLINEGKRRKNIYKEFSRLESETKAVYIENQKAKKIQTLKVIRIFVIKNKE
jgi:hypothetical protein